MIDGESVSAFQVDIHKNDTWDLNAQVNGVRSEHH